MILTRLILMAMVILLFINYLVVIGHTSGTYPLYNKRMPLWKACIPFYGVYRLVCPVNEEKKKKRTVPRKKRKRI